MLTPEKENQLRGLLARIIDSTVKQAGWSRTCVNCVFFDTTADTCRKWNMRPPATVIVVSCPDWEGEPF